MASAVYLFLFLGFMCEVKCFPAAENQTGLSKKENTLLKLLHKKYHFNDAEVEATKELMEDEKNNIDPEQDEIIFRLQVEEIVRKLHTMNDEEMTQIKSLFIRKMGLFRAEAVFNAAEELYEIEKAANEELEKSFQLNKGEEEAFEELVEDTEDGRDPETEDMEFKVGLSELADSYARLTPEQEERFKDLVEEEFGSEEAAKIFQEIQEIHKEMEALNGTAVGTGITLAAGKINIVADDQDNKKFWGELEVEVPDEGNEINGNLISNNVDNGMEETEEFWDFLGDPNTLQAEGANPTQAQTAGVNPDQAQYPGANPDQAQYPGANPDQAQYPGANPDQAQYPGANPDQAQYPGVNPDQAQYPGANPDQAQYPGANPDQAQYPGANPDQAQYPGANPDQAQYPGANPDQAQYPGANPDQAQYPGANPDQAQYPGANPDQAQYPGANPDQAQYPGANPDQAQYPGANPVQAQSAGANETETSVTPSNVENIPTASAPVIGIVAATPVSNVDSSVMSVNNSEDIFSTPIPVNNVNTSQSLSDHLEESQINDTSSNATGTFISKTTLAQPNVSISEESLVEGSQNKLSNISSTPTAVPNANNVTTTGNDESDGLNNITTEVYSNANTSGQNNEGNSSDGDFLGDISVTASATPIIDDMSVPSTPVSNDEHPTSGGKDDTKPTTTPTAISEMTMTTSDEFPTNVTIPVDVVDGTATVPMPISNNGSLTGWPSKDMENSKNQTTASATVPTNGTVDAEGTVDNSTEEDGVSAANVTTGIGDRAGEEVNKKELHHWTEDEYEDDDEWTTIAMTVDIPTSNDNSLVTPVNNVTNNSEDISSTPTAANNISTPQPLRDFDRLEESPTNDTYINATGTFMTTTTVAKESTFTPQTNVSIS